MFDDFQSASSTQETRKRLRRSMVAAVALYGGVGALIVGATATARHVVQEELTQVEFAPPPPPAPEPEPVPTVEPEPPKPQQAARRKGNQKKIKPPDKISDKQLAESDAALADPGHTGPTTGFVDGVEGGRGTAPAPKKIRVTPPKMSKRNKKPAFPSKARRRNVEGKVSFEFDVMPDGSTANVRVTGGPKEFHDAVVKTVRRWRFTPAMHGSTPVKFHKRMSITFRLDDP